jgi:LysR family carnitine catabolism transcriptional activator
MNLGERQLRMFVTTAALGNISRASEALHLSQPALTRAIALLEQQLGVALFQRTTRRVVLTPEGEAFLPTARRLLEDLVDAGRMFSRAGQGLQGRVTLAVGSSFGSVVLPRVVAELQHTHPGIQLRVVDDNSEGITRRVRLAEVDLGIGSPVGDIDALSCGRLLSAPLGLLAPPEHFTLTSEDAQGIPRLPLLKESADTSIMQLLRLHGSALLAPMSSGVEVSSLAIQLALARAGVGVAVLSALGASHPEAQSMQFLPRSRV